ncbi:MAG: PilZ domain-containing protein [Myxococcota bacterium]
MRTNHPEHRSGARVAVTGLRIDGPGADPVGQEVELTDGHADLSTGGVGFAIADAAALAVGDRITVFIELPDALDELMVRAEVRHVTPMPDGGYRVGATFIDADEIVVMPVFRYVEESVLAVRATTGGFGELLVH